MFGYASASWASWLNAAIYSGFVRDHPLYATLNREIAARSALETARRVLDLACGTGATTRACLERMGPKAELVGVDASAAMVELARAEVEDPRARFLVAAASAVVEVASGPFDRMVCNAAFWHFPDLHAVLGALASLAPEDGLLVFNIPAERLAGEPSPVHGLQVSVARAMEADRGEPYRSPVSSLDPQVLESDLRAVGFQVLARDRFRYRCSEGELLDLLRIPAMIGRVAPERSAEERRRILERVGGSIDPATEVVVPWIYYVARRGPRPS